MPSNKPPEYLNNLSLQDNFERYFEWGLDLTDPVATFQELGLEWDEHPLGFKVVYLTPRDRGDAMPLRGQVRANVSGAHILDDIHCHPFDFFSGIAKLGRSQRPFRNIRYYPEWGNIPLLKPDETGYIGYETYVDYAGKNHTVAATRLVPEPPSEVFELEVGDSYTMAPIVDFHAVDAEADTVTIFAKTPSVRGVKALMLRHQDLPPPPETY